MHWAVFSNANIQTRRVGARGYITVLSVCIPQCCFIRARGQHAGSLTALPTMCFFYQCMPLYFGLETEIRCFHYWLTNTPVWLGTAPVEQ